MFRNKVENVGFAGFKILIMLKVKLIILFNRHAHNTGKLLMNAAARNLKVPNDVADIENKCFDHGEVYIIKE